MTELEEKMDDLEQRVLALEEPAPGRHARTLRRRGQDDGAPDPHRADGAPGKRSFAHGRGRAGRGRMMETAKEPVARGGRLLVV